MRRTPLRRKPQRDPVTPELHSMVLVRDQGCVAPRIDANAGHCLDRWGTRAWVGPYWLPSAMTVDHVRDHPAMGKRAPSDAAHLVTLCWHHHLNGWATSHRPALRNYLAALYPAEPVPA